VEQGIAFAHPGNEQRAFGHEGEAQINPGLSGSEAENGIVTGLTQQKPGHQHCVLCISLAL